MQDVQKIIEQKQVDIIEHFNAGRISEVANMLTASTRSLPPNSETIIGRETVQTYWQAAYDSGARYIKADIKEIEVFEDRVIEQGEYALHIPQGENAITDTGKFFMIWKREDSDWKIDWDVWNTTSLT